MLDFPSMLFLLIAGHALADFPLQGEFLSQAKNRNTAIGKTHWPFALFAHAMIHGGFVLLITGSLYFAILEVAFHAVTDFLKCDRMITLNTDQFIHLACKVAWAIGVVMAR